MMRLLTAVGLLAAALPGWAAPVTSMDDIRYWIGDGANRAALAIDWDGDATDDEAIVWGYRWDGARSGEQMLRDVVAADARLFAKLGSHSLGLAVLGLGYDVDNNSAFAIDDGTVFDAGGIATASLSNADGAAAVEGDLYAEGWEDAYWHFSVGVSGAGGPVWSTSGFGPTTRQLTDDAWHGYAIAVTLNSNEFPQNLIAAQPHVTGDFNGDGHVDAADYTVWRDAAGAPQDYALWASAYGSSGNAGVSVPEPGALALICLLLLILHHRVEKSV
jgi:hypothetical protein